MVNITKDKYTFNMNGEVLTVKEIKLPQLYCEDNNNVIEIHYTSNIGYGTLIIEYKEIKIVNEILYIQSTNNRVIELVYGKGEL